MLNKKGMAAIVHPRIGWPKEETIVIYDGQEFVLHPWQTRDPSCRSDFILPSITSSVYNENKMKEFIDVLVWERAEGPIQLLYNSVQSHYNGSPPPKHGNNRSWVPCTTPTPWGSRTLPAVGDRYQCERLMYFNKGLQLLSDYYLEEAFLSFYKILEHKIPNPSEGPKKGIRQRLMTRWMRQIATYQPYRSPVNNFKLKVKKESSPGKGLTVMRNGCGHPAPRYSVAYDDVIMIEGMAAYRIEKVFEKAGSFYSSGFWYAHY